MIDNFGDLFEILDSWLSDIAPSHWCWYPEKNDTICVLGHPDQMTTVLQPLILNGNAVRNYSVIGWIWKDQDELAFLTGHGSGSISGNRPIYFDIHDPQMFDKLQAHLNEAANNVANARGSGFGSIKINVYDLEIFDEVDVRFAKKEEL